MKVELISSYINNIEDKIEQKRKVEIVSHLERLEDNDLINLLSIEMRNPLLVFMLSVIFNIFAVDRFYMGMFLSGVIKLLTFLCIITLPISIIWSLIDMYYLYNRCKKENTENLLNIISSKRK